MRKTFVCEIYDIGERAFRFLRWAWIGLTSFLDRYLRQAGELLDRYVISLATGCDFSQFGLTLSAKTEKFKQGPAVDDAGFYSSVGEGSCFAFHDLLTVKQNLN